MRSRWLASCLNTILFILIQQPAHVPPYEIKSNLQFTLHPSGPNSATYHCFQILLILKNYSVASDYETMTHTSTTPLYSLKNNGKYMNFQVQAEKDSQLAESDLRASRDEVANHGRRTHYPGQNALMQTALCCYQLKCLASQLRIVRAWVQPCVSAGVCSFYCGQLLDKYHRILQHIPPENRVPGLPYRKP
jgi:hypothetical protein